MKHRFFLAKKRRKTNIIVPQVSKICHCWTRQCLKHDCFFLGSSTYNCGGSLIASQGKLFSTLSLNHFLIFTKRKSLPTSHFLKGTMSRDLLLQVFSFIIFPQAPENSIRVIWKLNEKKNRFSPNGILRGLGETDS
jgi:hypothetical protein